jgi:hypothetical protein
MQLMLREAAVVCSVVAIVWAHSANAAFTAYDDRDEWESVTGDFTTIGFSEYPHGTWIFEQYAHLGVHFIDGSDIVLFAPETYPRDGYGIDGNYEVHLVFDMLITSIAVDFPGALGIDVYKDGEFVESTGYWGVGPIFVGFVFDEPFDEAIIWDDDHQVNIDDLHFGPPIPAPSALAVLAVGLLGPRRRRQRSARMAYLHCGG